GLSMGTLGKCLLLSLITCLIGSEHTKLAATSAEKTAPSNQPQASNQQAEQNDDNEEPLFPAARDGKYGFIDRKGNFVIAPTFASAGYFSEGLAPVEVEGRLLVSSGEGGQFTGSERGKWGYIDRTGKLKIPPQFGSANAFSEGLALVTV